MLLHNKEPVCRCGPNFVLSKPSESSSPTIAPVPMAGLFRFLPGLCQNLPQFVLLEIERRCAVMSEKPESTVVATKAAKLGLSLDAWAVVLALGLAFFVWIGWIKHVSW